MWFISVTLWWLMVCVPISKISSQPVSSSFVTNSATLLPATNERPTGPSSVNMPKLSPCASWNSSGTSVANSSTAGLSSFIGVNNTLYVVDRIQQTIRFWPEGSDTPTKTIASNLTLSDGFFVTINGDIYMDNGNNSRISQQANNATHSKVIMYINNGCNSLFFHINNVLYCSVSGGHQVIKLSSNSNISMLITVAGTGCAGSAPHMLDYPFGIYVHTNSDLYVADTGNNRVQFFGNGELNGVTVAGQTAAKSFILNKPTSVMLDADGALFIVDSGNHRIIRFGFDEYQCLIGCIIPSYFMPGQLFVPLTAAFDSYGNIFVTNRNRTEILKFVLSTNSCDARSTSPMQPSTMIKQETTYFRQEQSTTKSSVEQTSSVNTPKFSPCASWNSSGTSVANSSTAGLSSFIGVNNTLYVVDRIQQTIRFWHESSGGPQQTISGNLTLSDGFFVTINGDIYMDNGNNSRISERANNVTHSQVIMHINRGCNSLFVHINNVLYCSINNGHQVVKMSLNSNISVLITVAGTGCAGSASNMLDQPFGIYVHTNSDLYVADTGNNRVQFFHNGELKGVTATESFMLNKPTSVMLDGDGALFIVDSGNHRIVRSGPSGFQCLIGCIASSCSMPNQLCSPLTAAFDSYGDIFVTNRDRTEILKFVLSTNSCDATSTSPMQTSTMTKQETTYFRQAPSVNIPTFNPCASWNPSGTRVANSSTAGLSSFIGVNNTLYVVDRIQQIIRFWHESSGGPQQTISGNLTLSDGFFVTINGDIYMGNGNNSHISQWVNNGAHSKIIVHINRGCNSLFVHINNVLYCSINNGHQVVKIPLNSNISLLITVAGTGCAGSAANMLDQPFGIYVHTNSDLYVADTGNNRVQFFRNGDLNGETVAESFILNKPTSVMLDGDGALFIVDSGNHRIIRLGSDGYQCLIGCIIPSDFMPGQLFVPLTAAFDSYGNIFVTNRNRTEILKFVLSTNSCDATSTSPMQTSTMIKQETTYFRQDATSTSPMETSTMTKQETTYFRQDATSTSPMQTSTMIKQETTYFRQDATSTSPMETSTMIKQETTYFRQEQSTSKLRSTTKSSIGQTCFPPIVNLFPSPSDIETPLQFRRSQDFYINAIMKLNCAASLVVVNQWLIFNCTNLTCSIPTKIDLLINTTFSEIFIPARTLAYGRYEFRLKVTMMASPDMMNETSAYVEINPSGITANLVQFGTSLITSGHERDLILDPGTHSVNPDETMFNASDWTYSYQCRVYDSVNGGKWGPFDLGNNLCFSVRPDNEPAWRYNSTVSPLSSVTILGRSLPFNYTYQFVVFMINLRNLTSQATGYLLVQVENTRPQMVAVACVISAMCAPNLEYQYINPSTQVALFSECTGSCLEILNIHWNIYQGSNDSSSSIVTWIPFTNINSTHNDHFFGINTNNFTAVNTLFHQNPGIEFWRFEVTYRFPKETSSSALNFIINQPPRNGSCSISPSNGTTSTLFTINCTEWVDEDNIKDYSFYSWTKDSSEQVMLAFTTMSVLQLQLPAGDNNTGLLNLTVHIRDVLNCVAEFDMEPVLVTLDLANINSLIDLLQGQITGNTTNPIIHALASGNQNIVGQVVTLLSQEFNKRNKQGVEVAVASGVAAVSISVSPLGSESSSKPNASMNRSISDEYIQKLNTLANVRDYLMTAITDLQITNINSIKLQATSLAQLTETTGELTQIASMLASNKCHQLSLKLKAIATKTSYEDAQFAAIQLSHCVNNVLTAINAPLQERGIFFNTDSIRANTLFDDYDADLELILLNMDSIANGGDSTLRTNRILYHQTKMANKITAQSVETLSLITSILHIHLNIGQKITMNSSSLLVSLETTTIESLSDKLIQQVGKAQFQMPSTFDSYLPKNASVSLRSTMQPLAPAGASQLQANTNMSTAISLSLLDSNGKEISIHTSDDQPIEFFIPRDPNLLLPSMILQNVTGETSNFHFIDMSEFLTNSNLTISLHFEIRPMNISLGYLFIYTFDDKSQTNEFNGWHLFCPANLTNESSIYTYFIDNRQTSRHKSIVFGLRELNSTEIEDFCESMPSDKPSISEESFNFTSDYELRVYTSGCYYLDKYNNWQSDGLWVGPKTDHYKTQCFSTHLTTFTSSFLVVPVSIYRNQTGFQSSDEYILKQIDRFWDMNLTINNMQFDAFLYPVQSSLKLQ